MVAGVTDCIQMGNEIFNTILLQANPHGKPLVWRSWSQSLPPPRGALDPLVLHFEVVPASVWLLTQRGPNEERKNENVFQHPGCRSPSLCETSCQERGGKLEQGEGAGALYGIHKRFALTPLLRHRFLSFPAGGQLVISATASPRFCPCAQPDPGGIHRGDRFPAAIHLSPVRNAQTRAISVMITVFE